MSAHRDRELLRAAQAEGLLPASATLPQLAPIPWPLAVMTALGAWLATIPLVFALHSFSDGTLVKAKGECAVGILLLVSGLFLLRRMNLSLFLEQFIVAALVLVGLTHLALGTYRLFPDSTASLLMAAVTIVVGWAIPRRWMQCGFGALACYFFLLGVQALGPWTTRWESAHVALCVWILILAALRRAAANGVSAKNAPRIDALAAGWSVAVLLVLALYGGWASFFTSSLAPSGGGEYGKWAPRSAPAISVFLAFGAAAWAGTRWPSLVRLRFAFVAIVAAGLAWFMPSLGAILVVLAFSATSRRYVMAGASGVAAVFTFSAFYYQLDIPLATKALIMTATGALLAAIVWGTYPRALPKLALNPAHGKAGGISIAIGMFIALAAINASIWHKERLISTGAPVLVQLAPADPRSLLQGDYMRLRFVLPDNGGRYPPSKVVGQRDERGVTRLTRYDDGSALKPGELRINLVRKNHGVTLVTDAWFFAEGDGKRWEAAKYGEFRVDESGKALLVGLRDDKLRPIR